MEYGITKYGFVVKPFEKILEEQKNIFRVAFGEEIDLSIESVAGAYCYNQAIKLAQIWEVLGGLYTNGDINSASGVYLDRLAQLLDVKRKNATNTIAEVALWGDLNTVIPSGNILKDTSDYQYTLRKEVKLNQNNMLGVELKILTNDEGSIFNFSLGGVSFNYEAISGDDKLTIKTKIKNLIENTAPQKYIFEESDDDVLKFYIGKGTGGEVIEITSVNTIEIKKIANIGNYVCEELGAIFVGAGQINTIVTNVNGLDYVINYVDGETGENIESDDEFRIAIKQRQKRASGNEVAIANSVNKVEGVEYCKVYSNRKITVDSQGRPPKSFEVVVIGGDEDEIAKTIFDTAPAGIEAFGNTVRTVIDSEGFSWQIGFSRPINKFIWIKIIYHLNDEEQPNANIENSIKNNLVLWGEEELEISIDLIYQKLFTPIYKVKGIKDIDLKIAVSDTLEEPASSEYGESDILIQDREVALIDASRIFVEGA